MSTVTVYDVSVIDDRHAATVMHAITVATGPREAALQTCAARFGKWTGASSVQVASLCGAHHVRFDFDQVAATEYDR